MPVQFFHDDISFRFADHTAAQWVESIIQEHRKSLGQLNFIFTSDARLLGINKTYLDHDYYTDILTFAMNEAPSVIEGDIFISIDRVRDNAATHGASFNEELHRVMAHGLLHLLGFDDNTKAEQQKMREAEDRCLEKWESLQA